METRMEVAPSLSMQDSSGASRCLSRTKFIDLACAAVGRGSRVEFGLMFDGTVVAQNPPGSVNWRELCSFLLLELSDKTKKHRFISAPRWKPPRTLTCPHRDAVQRVLYIQNSAQYLSVSKGGLVVLRDRGDMSIVRTHRLQNKTVSPKVLWVTDVVYLQNTQKIAVSFTCREVCFYDILPKQDFNCKYKLKGLRFVPWCLDYWVDPTNPDQAILTIGDIGGQVSALNFTSAQISLFERHYVRTASGSEDIVLWDELVKGKHYCCYVTTHQAHTPDWVRKVRYLGSVQAFLSCSLTPQCSMAIGWRENGSRTLRVTSFATKSGVWDVDYHFGLGLIASAGVDHQVLLWNPCVTSKPVFALFGHSGPVITVTFIQTKPQVFSYSKDKVLSLWDVSSLQCVQRMTGIFPKTREDTHVNLLFQEEHQRLLLTFDSQLLLLETVKGEGRTSSHKYPVTCVLYNSLLKQVVSSDSGSTVISWVSDTGQMVKRFDHCHGNTAISTMDLDATQTRLFTAGADGQVKVWDFNGHCLLRMNAGMGGAASISQVLLLRSRVLVMGWKRYEFNVFFYCKSDVELTEWKGGVQHGGNVLCAAFQPPQTLVTGSFNGDIVVWNSSTEKALRKLQQQGENHNYKVSLMHAKIFSPLQSLGLNSLSSILTERWSLPHSAAFNQSPVIFSLTLSPKLLLNSHMGNHFGADLVSCGGLGLVHFWNIHHGQLVGQFSAHNKDLGSIVMAVSPCGKYLVTADNEGTIKTWDIEFYCLKPDQECNEDLPKLLHSFCPHFDHVTHLEICKHGDKLLLLSSSSDCNVALSYLSGETVGLFGQVNKHSAHLNQTLNYDTSLSQFISFGYIIVLSTALVAALDPPSPVVQASSNKAQSLFLQHAGVWYHPR
uniref:WD repeat domain 49 n=1 Tax=Nothobranchius furzeri TaxID=105023 RepID=A0A8C6NV26_NOTFU